MADNGDVEENEETPKDLRNQLKKAKQENTDLLDRLTKLEAKDRTRTVADVLADKGFSPKVAKLVPSDVEPNAESIEAWLKDNEDVFAVSKTDDEPDPASEGGDNVDPAAREAHERLASATDGAVPAGKAQDLEARMRAAKTPEELNEIIASAQL